MMLHVGSNSRIPYQLHEVVSLSFCQHIVIPAGMNAQAQRQMFLKVALQLTHCKHTVT